MGVDQWERITELFQVMLQMSSAEQQLFWHGASANDSELEEEVRSLLRAHQDAGSFLEVPPGNVAIRPATLGVCDQTPDPITGRTVSHYRVLARLGSGGMGIVYDAEDIHLGRRVALKFLPAHMASDSAAYARLKREARAASSLDHPNICPVYELGEHERQPFIVMQLLTGKTLREWIDESPSEQFTPRLMEALDLAVQIAHGLDAAHKKGMIHRDIKPLNIFVTKRGEVKILDFGLAKLLEDHTAFEIVSENSFAEPPGCSLGVTYPGAKMGTAYYMSPEQVRGETLDQRTDVFSLGSVIYEMVTGQRAFSGETREAVYERIQFSHPAPIRQFRAEVSDYLETLINKALAKDRVYRYRTASEVAKDLVALRNEIRTQASSLQKDKGTSAPSSGDRARQLEKRTIFCSTRAMVAAFSLVLFAISVGFYWRARPNTFKIAAREVVVLADFENLTGDPVFDGALRQGLIVDLEQSPNIRILSEGRAEAVLKQMGSLASERVSGQIAMDLCQRVEGSLLVKGSIAQVGTTYLVGLTAVRCENAEAIAHEQIVAKSKDAVIAALGEAATDLRARIGEAASSIRKYNIGLEQATTSSLEALKVYSIAVSTAGIQGEAAAIPLYQRALEIDPNFAMAYGSISECYSNRNEPELASIYASKAFALRGRLTEYERLSIESWYYGFVTGDVEKAIAILEVADKNYPDTSRLLNDLGNFAGALGDLDRAADLFDRALRLDPTVTLTRYNLASELLGLNRVDEAGSVLSDVERQSSQTEYLALPTYWRAFVLGNVEGMRKSVVQSRAYPGTYPLLVAQEANTQSYYGHYEEARHLTGSAATLLETEGFEESAANCWAAAAVREAEAGNAKQSRNDLEKAFRLAHNNDVLILAALATAQIGDLSLVTPWVDKLSKENPSNTFIRKYWIPVIRAEVELRRQRPSAAIDLLSAAEPYDLATPDALTVTTLYPAYVRGQAYLAIGDGRAAAKEFDKLLDHPGLVLNYPLGALAHLGKARALASASQPDKAREEYGTFLRLWKDADPGVPILKSAIAEHAKLL